MKWHELKIEARRKRRKRVGRGIAASGGKTAGRGTKGQGARTGKDIPVRFEGGQTSLVARLPKRAGFRPFRAKPLALRFDRIVSRFKSGDVITPKVLVERKILNGYPEGGVKIVGPIPKTLPNIRFKGLLFARVVSRKLFGKRKLQ